MVVSVGALALTVLTGHGPKFGQLSSEQGRPTAAAVQEWTNVPRSTLAAISLAGYPGQRQRGVFATMGRVIASGNTIVAMGATTSGGITRQLFYVSSNGGASWSLAPVRTPDGGQPPPGHPATILAGGPGGWLALGPQAIWTSQDGLTWTLAATHGITPMAPGDADWVLTKTSTGFLAAGVGQAGGGQTQAVIWTSPDGLTWQRSTAAQLGLAAGAAVRSTSRTRPRAATTR